MDKFMNSLKAVVAAVVSFGSVWLVANYGIAIPEEMQATLVAVITGGLVWLIPNKS